LAQRGSSAQGVGVRRGLRIIVVEDDDVLRRVLAAGLTSLGYTVDLCVSGRHAVERLEAIGAAPVLLMIDIDLLDMPAASLIELVRLDLARDDLPIALMTGRRAITEVEGVATLVRPPPWHAVEAWCAANGGEPPR
jgi:CheY-like chemotaxis protein